MRASAAGRRSPATNTKSLYRARRLKRGPRCGAYAHAGERTDDPVPPPGIWQDHAAFDHRGQRWARFGYAPADAQDTNPAISHTITHLAATATRPLPAQTSSHTWSGRVPKLYGTRRGHKIIFYPTCHNEASDLRLRGWGRLSYVRLATALNGHDRPSLVATHGTVELPRAVTGGIGVVTTVCGHEGRRGEHVCARKVVWPMDLR